MYNGWIAFFFPDDDDRDMQGDRAVDYGKRHQAIDILWMGTCTAVTSSKYWDSLTAEVFTWENSLNIILLKNV